MALRCLPPVALLTRPPPAASGKIGGPASQAAQAKNVAALNAEYGVKLEPTNLRYKGGGEAALRQALEAASTAAARNAIVQGAKAQAKAQKGAAGALQSGPTPG